MVMEPIRFHEVHGQNISLSNHGTEAARTESFNQALCFTNRPLAADEKLVIKVIEASKAWSGTLRVGVTEHDPRSLAYNLPKYVCPDLNMQPGNWGKALEEHLVKLNQEITIFHKNGRVMLHDGERMPEEFITGVPKNKPLYVLFDVYGNTTKIQIRLKGDRATGSGEARPPVGTTPGTGSVSPPRTPQIVAAELNRLSLNGAAAAAAAAAAATPIRSEAYGSAFFSRATFVPYDSENIKVDADNASSTKTSLPKTNCAVTRTSLSAKQTLVVRLKKLHNFKPIRMILTTEEPMSVYRFGDLDKLCDSTYSISVASDSTKTGEELAISISLKGAVYASHNNLRWYKRVHVDADLPYHVVFDMENIADMSIIGITEDIQPKDEPAAAPPATELQKEGGVVLPDCIICLENPRGICFEPCNHLMVCEPCWKKLQKTEKRECPVCRGPIKGVKKVFV